MRPSSSKHKLSPNSSIGESFKKPNLFFFGGKHKKNDKNVDKNASRLSIFKPDSKAQNQVIGMISELISSCSKIEVVSPWLREIFQRKLKESGLLEILSHMEASGQLKDILNAISFRFRTSPEPGTESTSVSNSVINEMFYCAKS